MKDPKVAEMVKDLNTMVKELNKLNVKLYKQGVSYRMEESYDDTLGAKQVEVNYLKQTVEY